MMKQIESIAPLRETIAVWRRAGEKIAFVPTMGNLHEGHLALVKKAQVQAQRVVVSVFVNPMQFSAGEDFDKYPRTLEQDSEALQEIGVDLLFVPTAAEIYNQDLAYTTRVEVPLLSDILCGASRPGHFVGVTTIVAKLFNIVQPDIAVFGKKDYQQLFLIRRMVRDLAIPIEILGVETAREESGLAVSSRNGYLSTSEKEQAAQLYQVMCQMAEQIQIGNADFKRLQDEAITELKQHGFEPDYVEIRHCEDLSVAQAADSNLVILLAAKLGTTRLIDNLEVMIPSFQMGSR